MTTVRSQGRDETTKRRGDSSRGRGRGTLPLSQPKPIRKKATTGRGRGADFFESSSYVPSREASEGNSVSIPEEQAVAQSRPQGQSGTMDEASSSHSTSVTPQKILKDLCAIKKVDNNYAIAKVLLRPQTSCRMDQYSPVFGTDFAVGVSKEGYDVKLWEKTPYA
nr:uncharacterized protein LOC117275327 [Nicotiana tomentosiformis]